MDPANTDEPEQGALFEIDDRTRAPAFGWSLVRAKTLSS
jgi:hypothetical protein